LFLHILVHSILYLKL